MDLFKKHFKFQRPIDMLKYLYETKKKTEENNDIVNMIKSRLSDLKIEVKKCLKTKLKLNSQRK